MATHSSILAWEIPRTKEPGGLYSAWGHQDMTKRLSTHIADSLCCTVVQSCPTLCDPMDCSPPISFVRGISQARILEWVAISFSNGSVAAAAKSLQSCPTL